VTLVPGLWRLAGVTFVVVGFGPIACAGQLCKCAGATVKPFESSLALLLATPFRIPRNPTYLGAPGLAGNAAGMRSDAPLAGRPGVSGRSRCYIVPDERELEATFAMRFLEDGVKSRSWT
jgi:hypothetical protein